MIKIKKREGEENSPSERKSRLVSCLKVNEMSMEVKEYQKVMEDSLRKWGAELAQRNDRDLAIEFEECLKYYSTQWKAEVIRFVLKQRRSEVKVKSLEIWRNRLTKLANEELEAEAKDTKKIFSACQLAFEILEERRRICHLLTIGVSLRVIRPDTSIV